MDSDRALDDLKAIRQIMERTRRATGRYGGWFGVLWGSIWFVGFLGSQFLPDEVAGWLWLGLDTFGTACSIWLGVHIGRHGAVRSPVWRSVLFWFLALIVFDGLLMWLFDLNTGRDIALLIILTIALSSFQFGLFTSWKLSVIGALMTALAAGAAVLLPNYFHLVMAFLGGGLMVGSGVWFVRHGE
ncbi:MAG: hypothetical protein ACE5OS_02920 [Anaerolineae bacterium]